MAAQALQAGRMLSVIPSDNAQIPYPALSTSGTNTSTASSKLIASGATFQTNGIQIGDIVYNITDSTAAKVVSIDSQTQLTLNANIFTGSSKTYKIYSGTLNKGCVFYVGGAGNVKGENEAGDVVTFVGLLAGEFVPVHLTKIYSTDTTATYIIALW